MEIRLAGKEDLEDYSILKKEFLREYGLPSITKDFMLDEFKKYLAGAIVLAIENNELIGYLLGEIESNEYWKVGYISEIFVRDNWRGKSVATKLKDSFLNFLKERGIHECKIDVNPDNPAIKAYERWGFSVDKFRMSLKF